MSDIEQNLRRLQEVASKLDETTDDLNDSIRALTLKLNQLGVSVTAWIESADLPGWQFGFCRVDGEWMLAARRWKEGACPLTNCPRKGRLEAVMRMGELLAALVDKSEQFIRDVEKAKEAAEVSIRTLNQE